MLILFAVSLVPGRAVFCGALFLRGDVDSSGAVNVSDAVAILRYLFASRGAVSIPCQDAADADDNGRIDIADAIAILCRVFHRARHVPEPYMFCGRDFTPDSLDCETFPACAGELGSIERDADAVVFVIDRSGGMLDSGELAIVKREAISTIQNLRDEGEFGVVFFDKGALRFPPAGPPLRMVPEARIAVIEFIKPITGGSGTCPLEGLLAALEMLSHSNGAGKAMIYFSDGSTDCPDSDAEAYARETLHSVTEKNTDRVRIHTVGVLAMDSRKERFLRDLAAQNGGTFYRISR